MKSKQNVMFPVEQYQRKIVTSMTYDHTKQRRERADGISKTIPDQVLTMREMLDRYVHGLPIRGAKVPIYDDDVDLDLDLPDPRTLDLHEKAEYERIISEEVKNLRSPKNKKDEEKAKDVPEKSQGENGSTNPPAIV